MKLNFISLNISIQLCEECRTGSAIFFLLSFEMQAIAIARNVLAHIVHLMYCTQLSD